MAEMTLLWVVLALVLAIAWIVMPFAIIGTKPILRQLVQQQQRTNELLQRQIDDATEERRQAAKRDAPA